jgi:hypothetical protein
MAFETFLQQYGWAGFIAYVVMKEILPFVRDKFIPHKMAEERAERTRLQKLEERAIQNEERQTKALEEMNAMMREFITATTTSNERMAQLIAGHALHDRSMQDALGSMREKIAASVAKKEN